MKKIWLISYLVIMILIAMMAGLSYNYQFNYRIETVLSDSMKPTFKAGSLILIKKPNIADYKIGDIVSFKTPTRMSTKITHRITEIDKSQDGLIRIKTKGDNNTNGDSWVLTTGNILGRYVLSIPYLGYGVVFIQSKLGFLILTMMSFAFLLWFLISITIGFESRVQKNRIKTVTVENN